MKKNISFLRQKSNKRTNRTNKIKLINITEWWLLEGKRVGEREFGREIQIHGNRKKLDFEW